jgi:hypothetical protein
VNLDTFGDMLSQAAIKALAHDIPSMLVVETRYIPEVIPWRKAIDIGDFEAKASYGVMSTDGYFISVTTARCLAEYLSTPSAVRLWSDVGLGS